mgnify:CR=1 FL=1
MVDILKIIQIVLAIALIASILLQNRGSGLSGVFGGSGGGNMYMARRGLEKKLHISTIIVAVAFFLVVLL